MDRKIANSLGFQIRLPLGLILLRAMLLGLCLILPMSVSAEIYQYIDEHGLVHFSDQPPAGITSGLNHGLNNGVTNGLLSNDSRLNKTDNQKSTESINDPAALEKIAKELRSNRVQREKQRAKAAKTHAKRRQKQKKAAKAKQQKKKACQLARKKEEAAFRNRTNKKNLKQMESALASYEKKRDLRKQKCR